jgi:hypothetical protein
MAGPLTFEWLDLPQHRNIHQLLVGHLRETVGDDKGSYVDVAVDMALSEKRGIPTKIAVLIKLEFIF